jgi:hypothetical protein
MGGRLSQGALQLLVCFGLSCCKNNLSMRVPGVLVVTHFRCLRCGGVCQGGAVGDVITGELGCWWCVVPSLPFVFPPPSSFFLFVRGSFGNVYKGTNKQTGEEVAVKIMNR